MLLSFFAAGQRGGYAIKPPSFEVEEKGCRQRSPSVLWFCGSCSSIIVLTTSLTSVCMVLHYHHLFKFVRIHILLSTFRRLVSCQCTWRQN